MKSHADGTPDEFRLTPDDSWLKAGLPADQLHRLDPGLGAVVALIAAGEWDEVFRRTGIRLSDERSRRRAGPAMTPPASGSRRKRRGNIQYLPLLVEFRWPKVRIADARNELKAANLDVHRGFFAGGLPRFAAARIALDADKAGRLARPRKGVRATTLQEWIISILTRANFVARLELPGQIQALNDGALADIEISPATRRVPATRAHPKFDADGSGVIIGIIDDGCAFVHPNFLRTTGGKLKSRILSICDQGRTSAAGGWKSLGSAGYELTGADIDAALADPKLVEGGIVDEDKVYARFNHEIADLASHGTHVMDIAAGNGRSLLGTEGVAPGADIIFVQLPTASIASGGAALGESIVKGINYIFGRAGNTPVVINISYGGYLGPHDGTSIVEGVIDTELAKQANRSIVVAAGNGFEADCHARGVVPADPRRPKSLRWVLKPEDPSGNTLEIWYEANAQLAVTVTPPGRPPLPAIPFGAPPHDLSIGADTIGRFTNQRSTAGAGPNYIRIDLNPTGTDYPTSTTALAPSGTWRVELTNGSGNAARFDAWIERDTSGRPGGARRRQSHFHPDDAEARGTLASYATSNLAIAVGAYNTATQQVCRYSACGPTRTGDPKPDVLAPAEEDAAGRGILCASSRSARPSRMNGTSAAAPQVTGLVALLLQVAAEAGRHLSAAEIRDLVSRGAANAEPNRPPLVPNAHVDADDRRRTRMKQSNARVWRWLTGNGKVNWPETRDLV